MKQWYGQKWIELRRPPEAEHGFYRCRWCGKRYDRSIGARVLPDHGGWLVEDDPITHFPKCPYAGERAIASFVPLQPEQ